MEFHCPQMAVIARNMPIFNQFVPHLRCLRKYCRREVLEENVIDAEMLKRIDFFRLSAVRKGSLHTKST